MILSFQDFLNEEYTLNQINSIASKYSDRVFTKNFVKDYKNMLAAAKDKHEVFYDAASRLLSEYESKLNFSEFRDKWEALIYDFRYVKKDATIQQYVDMIKKQYKLQQKYKDFLTNKYHKDTNMNYAGDENSPYLYHYTTLKAFMGIISDNQILGYSDTNLIIPGTEEECYICNGNGVEDCHICDGAKTTDCDECGGEGEIECYCSEGDDCECQGEGKLPCTECEKGFIECTACDGTGEAECDRCYGNGMSEEDGESAGGACFTTDADLFKKGFSFGTNDLRCGIKMKLDFNKIKADRYEYILGDGDIGTVTAENEIRIRGHLNDVKKYLLTVEVFPNKLAKNEEEYTKAVEFLKQHNIKYRVKA
jgi:hypothetical protein